jgi:hypothetical protein
MKPGILGNLRKMRKENKKGGKIFKNIFITSFFLVTYPVYMFKVSMPQLD